MKQKLQSKQDKHSLKQKEKEERKKRPKCAAPKGGSPTLSKSVSHLHETDSKIKIMSDEIERVERVMKRTTSKSSAHDETL